MARRLAMFVWLLGISLAVITPCNGAGSVTLTVTEREGVDRINAYVQSGVPLPRNWNVTAVSGLRLKTVGGTAVPAQFDVLARWAGAPGDSAKPIKWVLVGFFTTLSASASLDFVLAADGPGPAPTATIDVDDNTASKLTVDTE